MARDLRCAILSPAERRPLLTFDFSDVSTSRDARFIIAYHAIIVFMSDDADTCVLRER